ncbi:MAG: S-formylglutathione hydrolase [Polyangiaceae bacterium]
MSFEPLREHRCFEGTQGIYRHHSAVCNADMEVAIYLPDVARQRPVPVVTWLSGLTCTWENFTIKSGAQRIASRLGLALIIPDTSPRVELPGDRDRWDFGIGASYYVDATESPWSAHYRMFSYITEELPQAVGKGFSVDLGRHGIMGHSMGGHGALISALRRPDVFKSVSALAPISSLSTTSKGEFALERYLGIDRSTWADYDAALLCEKGYAGKILVDQGTNDGFLDELLQPEKLREACAKGRVDLDLRMQRGFDHSYYFVASFLEDHLNHHASIL